MQVDNIITTECDLVLTNNTPISSTQDKLVSIDSIINECVSNEILAPSIVQIKNTKRKIENQIKPRNEKKVKVMPTEMTEENEESIGDITKTSKVFVFFLLRL
jgi:hypothetical protein